jgi:hypothetical protein
MIIWLASYPKSGNTFLRSLLTAYLLTNDGKFNLHSLGKIYQFPDIKFFKELNIDTSKELEVVKNYIKVQEKINSEDNNSIRFVKTHSSLNDINGYKFTDLKNTLGAIYIVRDPRTIIKSYANHNQMSLEASCNRLLEFGATIGGLKNSKVEANHITTHMGSWSSNYNTWKEFKKVNKYLLVKYEDLVLETEKTFLTILDFIFTLAKSKLIIDKIKLKNTLQTTTFESLQSLEKKVGFPEAVINKDGKKIPFFKYGPKNNKIKDLPEDLKNKIEFELENEMKELGYI